MKFGHEYFRALVICTSKRFTKLCDMARVICANEIGESFVKILSFAVTVTAAAIAFSPSLRAADCPAGSTCPSPQSPYPQSAAVPSVTLPPAQLQPFVGTNQPAQPVARFQTDTEYPGP